MAGLNPPTGPFNRDPDDELRPPAFYQVVAIADPWIPRTDLPEGHVEKGVIELIVLARDPDTACAGVMGQFVLETQRLLAVGMRPMFRDLVIQRCRRVPRPPNFQPGIKLPTGV